MKRDINYWLPNKKATIIFGDNEYDYFDIRERVMNISQKLKSVAGGGKNIGVYMDRCPDIVFSMIASLITGNIYVPIDTSMPKERVNYILANANVEYVLTLSKYKQRLKDKKTIILDDNKELRCEGEFEDVENDDAYIIYTSGSTGTPKGVCITKHSLSNFMEGVAERIEFDEGRKIACFTSCSFDIFFMESVMALHKGLRVYMADEQQAKNPLKGIKLITDNNIEMLQITPSRIQQYINCDSTLEFLNSTRILMIGGEELSHALLGKLQAKVACKIYNMYGPTETTIWSTIGDVTFSKCVHAGEAIKNIGLYVIDENLEVCSRGVKGELCITGKGLAKEYYNNRELTDNKFIFVNGERAYRTGDFASIAENNKLQIYGRIDNQVKIRGYRVELEEIENVIRKLGLVDNIVVLAIDNEDRDKILVGFYSEGVTKVDILKLTNTLDNILPKYMIPVQFYKVDEFPLTVTGKVDRKKILINFLHYKNVKNDVTEMDEVEQRVINIIKGCIKDDNVTIEMNTHLAGIGVDSILLVKIIVEIECEFNIEFSNDDEFEELMQLKAVGECVDIIKKKLNSMGNKMDKL